jgi:1-acyl-sn-glycerol-3-phosphate acyltransferase
VLLVRSIAFAIVFNLTTALLLVLGSPLLLAPRSWAMAGLKLHARVSLWWLRVIVGTRMEVRGQEKLPEGPFLIAAKHQSAWDTFALILLFRDPAVVMKAELMRIPLYGWFSRKFGMIPIRRERGPAALREMVRAAKKRIEAGRTVLVFPEGTRRLPGAAPDYKPGVLLLYEGLGVPCVPLALNSGLFWPRRKLFRYPGTIVVEILDPIPPGWKRPVFKAELERRIESACRGLLEEVRQAPNPPPLPVAAAQNAVRT